MPAICISQAAGFFVTLGRMSVFVLQGEGNLPKRRIDYARELNQEQLDVVLNGDGPCLVLAGAGSGKTRTITYRVANLLESGVDPARILLLTFTNKAARSMMGRVSSLLGAGAEGVWGGTFHSIGNRILRTTADLVGYTSRFTILDQDDAQSLIKAVMKELRIDPKARRFPTASVVHSILSFTQNTMSSVEDTLQAKYPNFEEFASDLEEIGRIYATRKRSANAMDFDDLLRNWLVVMAHPEAGQRIAQQFQYILVDEYQDTNALQAAIVKAVAAVHRNVLVVGDDAQSIYAFRGANVQNILNFPKEWHGSKMFKLLTNYRSVPEILELANESLSHNLNQFQKELIGVRERGKKPVLVAAASARQEAQYIAEQILALRAEGTALGNMAVLFRSSAHSQTLEFELMKRDIPYEYRGGMKFFERAHIKDVLAYVRICENPKDEAAWLRTLNLHQGIGAATAVALAKRLQAAPDIERALDIPMLPLPGRARAGWSEFSEILRRILRERPHPGMMLKAVLSSGYRDYLEREYPDWKDRLEDLEQLSMFAEGYRDTSSFLADIALYDEAISGRQKEGEQAQSERMVLSTIHQAKGLEWDTVFVIHLAENAFPSRRAMAESAGLEEERRLFYVAVTRARHALFLTYPVMSGFDTLALNQPSLFTEEVSPRLFDRMELREQRNMRPMGYGKPSVSSGGWRDSDPDRSDWSWDEPSIQLDDEGERRPSPSTKSVWKSSKKTNEPPRTSFLRNVDEL